MKLSEEIYNYLEKTNNPNLSKFRVFIYKDNYNKFEVTEEMFEFRRLFYLLDNIDKFSDNTEEFNNLLTAAKSDKVGRNCVDILRTDLRFKHPDSLCNCNTCISKYYEMRNIFNK